VILKGVGIMPSKQLIDLVNRLQKSGIQISFTKPRSEMSSHLYGYDHPASTTDINKYSCHENGTNRSILEFI
jgi:hypothetical protein